MGRAGGDTARKPDHRALIRCRARRPPGRGLLKPRISQDAGDQPDVGLLRRVEPEHRERLPERARGKSGNPMRSTNRSGSPSNSSLKTFRRPYRLAISPPLS